MIIKLCLICNIIKCGSLIYDINIISRNLFMIIKLYLVLILLSLVYFLDY